VTGAVRKLFVSWKTTASGASAIALALGDLLHQYATDSWDVSRLGSDLIGISTGIGLLFAKDANVTGGTVKQ